MPVQLRLLNLRLLPRFGVVLAAAFALLLLAVGASPPLPQLTAGRSGAAAAQPAVERTSEVSTATRSAAQPDPLAAARLAGAAAAAEAAVSGLSIEGAVAPAAARQQPATVAPPPPAPAAGPVERWGAQGIVLLTAGQEWDDDSLLNVDAALAALPARVRALLVNPAFGPLLVLVNSHGRTSSGWQPYGRAANFFATNERRNELVLFPRQRPQTILHELGHAFNLRRQAAGGYALVLLDPEMRSFMDATGWRLLAAPAEVAAARDHTQVAMAYDGAAVWTRLSHNDPLEDFANSFALYFWEPEELRRLSPVRYDWFAANVGR